jgi:hypothetical protein
MGAPEDVVMTGAIVGSLITGATAILSASLATGLNILRESLQARREDQRDHRHLWREKGFDLYAEFLRKVGEVQDAAARGASGAGLTPLRAAVSDQLRPIRMIASPAVRQKALELANAVQKVGDFDHNAVNLARASFEDAVREDIVGA